MVVSLAKGAPEENTERLRANVRFGSEADIGGLNSGSNSNALYENMP